MSKSLAAGTFILFLFKHIISKPLSEKGYTDPEQVYPNDDLHLRVRNALF